MSTIAQLNSGLLQIKDTYHQLKAQVKDLESRLYDNEFENRANSIINQSESHLQTIALQIPKIEAIAEERTKIQLLNSASRLKNKLSKLPPRLSEQQDFQTYFHLADNLAKRLPTCKNQAGILDVFTNCLVSLRSKSLRAAHLIKLHKMEQLMQEAVLERNKKLISSLHDNVKILKNKEIFNNTTAIIEKINKDFSLLPFDVQNEIISILNKSHENKIYTISNMNVSLSDIPVFLKAIESTAFYQIHLDGWAELEHNNISDLPAMINKNFVLTETLKDNYTNAQPVQFQPYFKPTIPKYTERDSRIGIWALAQPKSDS